MEGYYTEFQGDELPPVNGHPEMDDYDYQERLMVARLDLYSYNLLNERVNKQKMQELMEEPSSYEDEDDGPGYSICRR